MGGFGRQLFRNQAKVAYRQFVESWRTRAAENDGHVMSADGKHELRRPTFKEWLKMNKQAHGLLIKQAQLARLTQAEKVKEEQTEEDLSWE